MTKILPACHSGLLQDFRFFRDEFRPCGAGRIKQEQVVVGSLVIGLNQKLAADIFDDIVRIIGDFGNDGTERFLEFREVAIVDSVAALAFSAVRDAEDCESSRLRWCPRNESASGLALSS